jgi:hypothetical protein
MRTPSVYRNALFDLAYPEQARRRDELLDAVAHGRLEPEAAEAEARRLGLSPLCPTVNSEDFDVGSEPWWTLSMTIAWIVWRSMPVVREHYAPFRAACPVWTYQKLRLPNPIGQGFIQQSGFVLKNRPPSTYSLIVISTCYPQSQEDLPRLLTAFDARQELWRQLSLGNVSSVGIAQLDGLPRTIPAHEFPYLQLVEEDEADVLVLGVRAPNRAGYHNVLLSQRDVLRRWRAPQPKARDKRNSEKLCVTFFASSMQASPERPTLKRKQAEAIAKGRYGLGREAARRAWARAIEQTGAVSWCRPGRRPDNCADQIAPEE